MAFDPVPGGGSPFDGSTLASVRMTVDAPAPYLPYVANFLSPGRFYFDRNSFDVLAGQLFEIDANNEIVLISSGGGGSSRPSSGFLYPRKA